MLQSAHPAESSSTPASVARPADTVPAAAVPIVWLLQGRRLGDNQQVLALGAALEARFGWQLVVKQLKFCSGLVHGTDLAQAIAHVDIEKSDPIHASAENPWPNVVIGIGRGTASVARWIKAQNALKAIHVHLGRFQDPFNSVDLLVTTAQYGLPTNANMLHLSLPITARKKDALAAAAAVFAPVFAPLDSPLIGVLVGGPSNPIQFGAADAHRLVQDGLIYAAARKGTLLIATSPRTPAEVLDVLKRDLPAPHRLFPFVPGAGTGNPYPALLAMADAFIVTTDSVSMVADAALTGREVRLFDLPVRRPRALWKPSWPIAHWVGRRRNARLSDGKPADALDHWFDGQVRIARAQPYRYVPTIMNRLLREHHVALLSDPIAPRPGIDRLAVEELDMVVARIVALLAEQRAANLRERLASGGGLAARALSQSENLAYSRIGQLTPVMP